MLSRPNTRQTFFKYVWGHVRTGQGRMMDRARKLVYMKDVFLIFGNGIGSVYLVHQKYWKLFEFLVIFRIFSICWNMLCMIAELSDLLMVWNKEHYKIENCNYMYWNIDFYEIEFLKKLGTNTYYMSMNTIPIIDCTSFSGETKILLFFTELKGTKEGELIKTNND